MWPNLDPRTLYLSQKYSEKNKKYRNVLEHISVYIWESENLKVLEGLCNYFEIS